MAVAFIAPACWAGTVPYGSGYRRSSRPNIKKITAASAPNSQANDSVGPITKSIASVAKMSVCFSVLLNTPLSNIEKYTMYAKEATGYATHSHDKNQQI
jgi:hypothetical protein